MKRNEMNKLLGKTKKRENKVVKERSYFRSYPDFLSAIEKNFKKGNVVQDWTHGLDTQNNGHFGKVVFKDNSYITFISNHGLWLKSFMRFLNKLEKQYPNEAKQ